MSEALSISIADYLIKKGFSVVDTSESNVVTSHHIAKTELTIIGHITPPFPYSLPALSLKDSDQYGLLAHVSSCGQLGEICIGASDGFSLDFKSPEKVYINALNRALDILSKALRDPDYNCRECLREFTAHWRGFITSEPSLIYVGESKSIFEQLQLHQPDVNQEIPLCSKPVAYGRNKGNTNGQYVLNHYVDKRKSQARGKAFKVHLPFLPLPPAPKANLKAWFIRVIESYDQSYQNELRKWARRNKCVEAQLVFETTYNNEPTRFGFHGKATSKVELPLTRDFAAAWDLNAISIESHTRDYLLPRCGVSNGFQDKSVLLVGCGSLGSVIAEQLGFAGVGRLVLCDEDFFKSENLYRHILTMDYDGFNKTRALQHTLERKFPFTNCKPLPKSIGSLTEEEIRAVDLIIIAIGNLSHERGFFERLHAQGIHVPTINTWIEPYGIGGHTVYSPNGDSKGCYGCVFVDRMRPEQLRFTPNLNFVAEDQDKPIRRTLGACAGLFLPYSILDTQQTATIASRMALGVLSGQLTVGSSSSWSCKPTGLDAEAQQCRVTERFNTFDQQHQQLPIYMDTCPYCNKE